MILKVCASDQQPWCHQAAFEESSSAGCPDRQLRDPVGAVACITSLQGVQTLLGLEAPWA